MCDVATMRILRTHFAIDALVLPWNTASSLAISATMFTICLVHGCHTAIVPLEAEGVISWKYGSTLNTPHSSPLFAPLPLPSPRHCHSRLLPSSAPLLVAPSPSPTHLSLLQHLSVPLITLQITIRQRPSIRPLPSHLRHVPPHTNHNVTLLQHSQHTASHNSLLLCRTRPCWQ